MHVTIDPPTTVQPSFPSIAFYISNVFSPSSILGWFNHHYFSSIVSVIHKMMTNRLRKNEDTVNLIEEENLEWIIFFFGYWPQQTLYSRINILYTYLKSVWTGFFSNIAVLLSFIPPIKKITDILKFYFNNIDNYSENLTTDNNKTS